MLVENGRLGSLAWKPLFKVAPFLLFTLKQYMEFNVIAEMSESWMYKSQRINVHAIIILPTPRSLSAGLHGSPQP